MTKTNITAPCSVCGVVFFVAEWQIHRKYKNLVCPPCRAKRERDRRAANPEHVRELERRRYHKDPERAREKDRRSYHRNIEKRRAYDRERYPARRDDPAYAERRRLQRRVYRLVHKDDPTEKARHAVSINAQRKDPRLKPHIRARLLLHKAVKRGKITPQPCIVCGASAEAHHPDYSRPLDVVWLCKRHHDEVHAELRRSARHSVEGANP